MRGTHVFAGRGVLFPQTKKLLAEYPDSGGNIAAAGGDPGEAESSWANGFVILVRETPVGDASSGDAEDTSATALSNGAANL